MQAEKKVQGNRKEAKKDNFWSNSWFLFHITEPNGKVLGTASTALKDNLTLSALTRCLAPLWKHKVEFQHEPSRKYGMTFSGDSCGSIACN